MDKKVFIAQYLVSKLSCGAVSVVFFFRATSQLLKLRFNCDGHILISFVFPRISHHFILCFISFTG